MLRGFRWQLIALILSVVLFVFGLIYRSNIQPMPQITATIAPTSTPITLTSTALPEPTISSEIIPTPDANNIQVLTTSLTTYREALVGQVGRLNPIFAHLNPVDNDISKLIFEGLIKTNSYGEPVPALAKEWITSSDGLEYVFTLRDDVLWQDGIRFNADDVIYTMSLLSSPAYADYSPTADFWQTVETEKLADNLVRFRLTQPLGSFVSFLSIGILPEHALRGTSVIGLAKHPFNLSPIGTGAYQLAALRSNGTTIDAVDLQLAPVYRQRPEAQTGFHYSSITFNLYSSADTAIHAYQSGDVDGLANITSRAQLLTMPDARVYTQLDPALTMLIFNWDEGDKRFFTERRVRQALSISLDRQAIIEQYFANESLVADSPLILGSWAYQTNPLWDTVDLTQAQSLLSSANIRVLDPVSGTDEIPTPAEGEPLYAFSILVKNEGHLPDLAQDIANQWAQLGLTVTVSAVDATTYETRLQEADFNVAIVDFPVGADPDVYNYWHPGQYPDGENYGGASNDEIAELLESGRRENGGVNRLQLYQQFQKIFAEQSIAIPLYYSLYTFVVRNTIDGVQLGFLGTSADRFRNISQWIPAT